MKLMGKNTGSKGGGNLYSIVVGALVVIAILAAIKYFHDRDNDITIHLPKVEVH
jgi:hypothetical protein